jgi:hypothetical protein
MIDLPSECRYGRAMTTVVAPIARRAVRTPFRVLAGVICLVSVVAFGGTAYMAWAGARLLRVHDVVMVPGLLCFFRLAFYAAVYGTVPTVEYWPFASSRVANCYWLIFLVCSVAG